MELCINFCIVVICLVGAVGIAALCLIIFGTLRLKKKINNIENKLANINQHLENDATALIESSKSLQELPQLSLCIACYSLKLNSSSSRQEQR